VLAHLFVAAAVVVVVYIALKTKNNEYYIL
jgi:hypothetical protein